MPGTAAKPAAVADPSPGAAAKADGGVKPGAARRPRTTLRPAVSKPAVAERSAAAAAPGDDGPGTDVATIDAEAKTEVIGTAEIADAAGEMVVAEARAVEPGADDEPGAAEQPDTDGLPGALAAAAPRRWTNRATPLFAATVLLAGGFLGGAVVQKQWGKSEISPGRQTPRPEGGGVPSGFGGPGGAGGFGGQAGPNGRAGSGGQQTTGTLTAVTSTGLTLRTADGGTVTVKIAGGTQVLQPAPAAVLKEGQSVTVQGSTATDGSITATTVTAS